MCKMTRCHPDSWNETSGEKTLVLSPISQLSPPSVCPLPFLSHALSKDCLGEGKRPLLATSLRTTTSPDIWVGRARTGMLTTLDSSSLGGWDLGEGWSQQSPFSGNGSELDGWRAGQGAFALPTLMASSRDPNLANSVYNSGLPSLLQASLETPPLPSLIPTDLPLPLITEERERMTSEPRDIRAH